MGIDFSNIHKEICKGYDNPDEKNSDYYYW